MWELNNCELNLSNKWHFYCFLIKIWVNESLEDEDIDKHNDEHNEGDGVDDVVLASERRNTSVR